VHCWFALIKVSMIIPVFNGAENLRSCLAKLQEVITGEVQIVIVDDGSTDESFVVASEFARNFENVVLHKIDDNKGVGNARNVGIGLSVGAYIYFLDCDDTVVGDFLEGLDGSWQNKADLILTPIQRSSSEKINASFLSLLGKSIKKERKDLLSAVLQHEAWPVQCWGFFIRREFLIHNQIRFEPIRKSEDMAFITSVFLQLQTYAIVSEPVYVHNRRPGSLGKTFSEHEIESWFLAFVKVAKLAERYSIRSFEGAVLSNQLTYALSSFLIAFMLADFTSKKEFIKQISEDGSIIYLARLADLDSKENIEPDEVLTALLAVSSVSIQKTIGAIGSGRNYLYCYEWLSIGVYISLAALNFTIDGIIDDNVELTTPNRELGLYPVSPTICNEKFPPYSTIVVCHDKQRVFLSKMEYFKHDRESGLKVVHLTTKDFVGKVPVQVFFK